MEPKSLIHFFLLAKLRCVPCKICHSAATGSARCLGASPSARPPHVSHLTAAFEGLLSGVKGGWTCIAAPDDGRTRTQDTGCAIAGGSEWTLPLQNCFRFSCAAKRNACPHTMGERGPTLVLSLGPLQPACMSNKMPSCILVLLISGTLGANCGAQGLGAAGLIITP